MFRFDFDVDTRTDQPDHANGVASAQAFSKSSKPCVELNFSDLCDRLPPVISCTRLELTLAISLYRRDLFDARFQAAYEDDGQANAVKRPFEALENPSDLMRGSYEGGLKTWEGASDLIDCLTRLGWSENAKGTILGHILFEVGCGTALPSCYLLRQLFKKLKVMQPSSFTIPTRIILQDFNEEVLSTMTLPNILLAYGEVFDLLAPGQDDISAILNISSEFIQSFKTFLHLHGIIFTFLAGDWSDCRPKEFCSRADIVLTSETVYELSTIPDLVKVLDEARGLTICLVACKRVYFGVGGGQLDFIKEVESRGGVVEPIWTSQVNGRAHQSISGIDRAVFRITWAAS